MQIKRVIVWSVGALVAVGLAYWYIVTTAPALGGGGY